MTTNVSGTNPPEHAEVVGDAVRATERPRFAGPSRWAVGVLLIIHGAIHTLGPLDIWGIADIEGLTGEPTIDIGSTTADTLTVVWLLALVLLVTAGLGVLSRRPWWRSVAIVGVIVSQFVIIVWWDDAAAGTIANALVVFAAALAGRLGLLFAPTREIT